MENKLAEKLRIEGLFSEAEYQRTNHFLSNKLFSLHWEIKTVLYLGVTLLATGAGMIIYQNIDTISHQAILAFLALLCGVCFYYCFNIALPFNKGFVESPGLVFDYLLLLGCLLFLSFEGYFQYAYELFGNRYGLAVLLPSILFIFIAYRMDHKGVLSLAITGMAGWLGISASPHDLITGDFEFSDIHLIWTGLAFGIFIASAALLLEKKEIKSHFTFTYLNFSSHVLFISSLAGLIIMEGAITFLFLFLLTAFCLVFFLYSKRTQSFYFLLLSMVYGYIGITYLIMLGLSHMDDYMGLFSIASIYFISSCWALIYFLFNHKKFVNYERVS